LGGDRDAATTTIDQTLTFCGSEQGKLLALRSLITSGSLPPPTLIFVQSIDRANQLYRQLLVDGTVAEVGVVHSERSKAAREQAVREFREGKVWMLVVTELMARGLDFKGVEVVVNYGAFPVNARERGHTEPPT
jgi:ATP-dependent RNA helicase DDX52/ROK1